MRGSGGAGDVGNRFEPHEQNAQPPRILKATAEVGLELGPVLGAERGRIEVQQRAKGRHRRLRCEAARTRKTQELGKALGLCPGDRRAKWRDPVVAAALVVQFGRRARACLDEQPLIEHALDRAIQRSRTQAQRARGSRLDILDDRVAVPIFVGDGHQDMEGRGWERKQGLGSRRHGHAAIISAVDIDWVDIH